MSKIVFFDIDGTLLDHEKNLPVKTKEAIKQLQENGVFVAIATGRAPFMFESLREELAVDSFVSFNGQYVVFENEVIYKNPLNAERVDELLRNAEHNGHPLVFLNENTMKSNVEHHTYIEDSMGSLKFPHPALDLTFYKENEIYQANVFCRDKEETGYITDFPDFHFIRWHDFSIDVLPAGGSKAEGIAKMIERLGFKMEDVYAFGDGLNDIEMIETVGNGVAMGNAVPSLKEAAKYVTADVDDGGIWKGLKNLELI